MRFKDEEDRVIALSLAEKEPVEEIEVPSGEGEISVEPSEAEE